MKVKEINDVLYALRIEPHHPPYRGSSNNPTIAPSARTLQIWSISRDVPGSTGDLIQRITFPNADACSFSWSHGTSHFIVVTNKEIIIFNLKRTPSVIGKQQYRRAGFGKNHGTDPLDFVDELRESKKRSSKAKMQKRNSQKVNQSPCFDTPASELHDPHAPIIEKCSLSQATNESLIQFEDVRRIRIVKSFSIKYLAFTYPILFLHSEEETVVMNTVSTVYQNIGLDSDRIINVNTVTGNVLSYDGKYLAICDLPGVASVFATLEGAINAAPAGSSVDPLKSLNDTIPTNIVSNSNGEVLKIFDLSQLLHPPSHQTSSAPMDDSQFKLECKVLTAELEEGDLVTGIHWRANSNQEYAELLTLVFQNGSIVIYEVYQERDTEDDEIVAMAIKAALSAGVVDHQKLPRRINKFLPQIRLASAIHIPSLFDEILPVVSVDDKSPFKTLFCWIRGKDHLNGIFDPDTAGSIFLSQKRNTDDGSVSGNVNNTSKQRSTTFSNRPLEFHSDDLWILVAMIAGSSSSGTVIPPTECSAESTKSNISVGSSYSHPGQMIVFKLTPRLVGTSSAIQGNFQYEVDERSQFIATPMFNLTSMHMHFMDVIGHFSVDKSFPSTLSFHAKQDSPDGYSIVNRNHITLHPKTLTMSIDSSDLHYFYNKIHNYINNNLNPYAEHRIITVGKAILVMKCNLPYVDFKEVILEISSTGEKGIDNDVFAKDGHAQFKDFYSHSALRASASSISIPTHMGLLCVKKTNSILSLYLVRKMVKESSIPQTMEREGDLDLNFSTDYISAVDCEDLEGTVEIGSCKARIETGDKIFKIDSTPPASALIFSVPIVPDLHFGLGLRLDQSSEDSSGKIVVTSFKRHPITKEPMAAELSGLIQIGDELVAIDESPYYRQPINTVIPAIRAILNSIPTGKEVILKFTRDISIHGSSGNQSTHHPFTLTSDDLGIPSQGKSPLRRERSHGLIEAFESSRLGSSLHSAMRVIPVEDFYRLPIFTCQSKYELCCGGQCLGYLLASAKYFPGFVLILCSQERSLIRVKAMRVVVDNVAIDPEVISEYSLCSLNNNQLIGSNASHNNIGIPCTSSIHANIVLSPVREQFRCDAGIWVQSVRIIFSNSTGNTLCTKYFVLDQFLMGDGTGRIKFYPQESPNLHTSVAQMKIATSPHVAFLRSFAMVRSNISSSEDTSPLSPISPVGKNLITPPSAKSQNFCLMMSGDASLTLEDDALELYGSLVSPFADKMADKFHDILNRLLKCYRVHYDEISDYPSSWSEIIAILKEGNGLFHISSYIHDKIQQFLKGNANDFALMHLYDLPLSSDGRKRCDNLKAAGLVEKESTLSIGDHLTSRSGLLGLYFVAHSIRILVSVILSCDVSLVARTLAPPGVGSLTQVAALEMLQVNEAQLQCLIMEKFMECCKFDRYALTAIWESLLQQCWIDIVDTAALALENVKPDIFKKRATAIEDDAEGNEDGGVDFTLDYSKTFQTVGPQAPNHTVISSIQAANMVLSGAQSELFDSFMGCVYTKEDLDNDLSRQFVINLGHENFNTGARAFVSKQQEQIWDPNCMAGIDILSYATDMKIGFWLHDLSPLIDLIHRHTLRKFKFTKSSMQVF